jgi:hypothetical protein
MQLAHEYVDRNRFSTKTHMNLLKWGLAAGVALLAVAAICGCVRCRQLFCNEHRWMADGRERRSTLACVITVNLVALALMFGVLMVPEWRGVADIALPLIIVAGYLVQFALMPQLPDALTTSPTFRMAVMAPLLGVVVVAWLCWRSGRD